MTVGSPRRQILLIEDNPGDVLLTKEAFQKNSLPYDLHIVNDGKKGLAFLRRQGDFSSSPRPNLIFLDLNLPEKSGFEALKEIKSDPDLRRIPVIVLTSSAAGDEVRDAYALAANCYVDKPADMKAYLSVLRSVESFWMELVRLPQR